MLPRHDDIEILDLTPHPEDRLPLIEAALRADKDLPSQKPFVTVASALPDFGGAQSSLVFDATKRRGPPGPTYIAGSEGSLVSHGPDLGQQTLEFYTENGLGRPSLRDTWFNDGFAGAMGALLVAKETESEPANGARGNLLSVANTFAALKAAATGQAQNPENVRSRTS